MTSEVAVVGMVLLPLLAALPAVVWPRQGKHFAAVGLVATWVCLTVLWIQLWQGPVSVVLGSWPVPLGIAWAVDGARAALFTLAGAVMTAVLIYARKEFALVHQPEPTSQKGREKLLGQRRQAESFWPLMLLLWTGLNLVVVTDDLFNAYVGLELVSLSAVAVVALAGNAEALSASLRYLAYALMGSLWYLLGVTLLYGQHATLDVGLLSQAAWSTPTDILALAIITVGLFIKTALFPFHAWLPSAHASAPAAGSAVLSALVPKVAFLLILKIWLDAGAAAASPAALNVLGVLGAMAVVYGSLLALRQERLKLLIAWSTVAQIGYLFFVFPLAGGPAQEQPWSTDAWSGMWFQLVSHGLAKAAMFLCAGLWLQALGHDRITGLRGMVNYMPITVLAFGLAGVSLMGLPPSGGFAAKYLLLVAAFAAGQWWWAVVIVLGGLLAALYLYRPLAAAMSRPETPPELKPVAAGWQCLPLLLALTAALLGLASAWPFEALQIGRPDWQEGPL